RGERAVLEVLVARRPAAAEAEVAALLPAHLHPPRDLPVQGEEALRGQDRRQRVLRDVTQREAAVPQARQAEQLRGVGRQVAVTADIEDRERLVCLRPVAGAQPLAQGRAGRLVELTDAQQRRVGGQGQVEEAPQEAAEQYRDPLALQRRRRVR